MVIGHTPVSKGSFSCSPSRVTCALASLEADGGGWADIRPGQIRLSSFVVPRDLK
jgi:hypothetical protein